MAAARPLPCSVCRASAHTLGTVAASFPQPRGHSPALLVLNVHVCLRGSRQNARSARRSWGPDPRLCGLPAPRAPSLRSSLAAAGLAGPLATRPGASGSLGPVSPLLGCVCACVCLSVYLLLPPPPSLFFSGSIIWAPSLPGRPPVSLGWPLRVRTWLSSWLQGVCGP